MNALMSAAPEDVCVCGLLTQGVDLGCLLSYPATEKPWSAMFSTMFSAHDAQAYHAHS